RTHRRSDSRWDSRPRRRDTACGALSGKGARVQGSGGTRTGPTPTLAPANPGASVQPVEGGAVAAGNQRALALGHVLEVFGQRLARLRPCAVGMGIVRRPHDVPQAGAMALGNPGEVLDERRVPLPVPVEARLRGDDG